MQNWWSCFPVPYHELFYFYLEQAEDSGGNFFGVGNKVLSYDFTLTESTRFPASLSFPEVEATFVRLDLLSGGLCPKGYFNEGEQSRLAIDEIEIN